MLALLASTVLFVLSEDRLNMDLDTDSLKLIIALSKTGDTAHIADDSHENAKLRQRVIDLVSEMKNRGHAKHLKNEKITAAELALETLLYLTSKRAGDFLKHELRALGGLDYIVTEVVTSLDLLRYDVSHAGFSENVVDRLWKIDRCLLVLQQVTFNHEENQRYLLRVSDEKSNDLKLSGSPEIFISLFRFCNDHLKLLQRDSESAKVLHEILFNVLRVLGNLSQDHRGIGKYSLTKFQLIHEEYVVSDDFVQQFWAAKSCVPWTVSFHFVYIPFSMFPRIFPTRKYSISSCM